MPSHAAESGSSGLRDTKGQRATEIKSLIVQCGESRKMRPDSSKSKPEKKPHKIRKEALRSSWGQTEPLILEERSGYKCAKKATQVRRSVGDQPELSRLDKQKQADSVGQCRDAIRAEGWDHMALVPSRIMGS